MINEYVDYLKEIEGSLNEKQIRLPLTLTETDISNIQPNICILQSVIDFNAVLQTYSNFSEMSVVEFLTRVFTEDYNIAWQKQIQELLKDPVLIENTLEEVDMSFEGFVEDSPLTWDDIVAADIYESADELLQKIDCIQGITPLPEKKDDIAVQSKAYLDTMKMLNTLDMPLFSFLS